MAIWTKNIAIVRSLIFFGHLHIYPTERTGKYAQIANKRANDLMQNSLVVIIIILIAGVLYLVYPIYEYIVDGVRPMPVPIIVPFVDPDTTWGYLWIIGNQLAIATVGFVANMGIEIMVALLVNNLWAASDNIQYALDELALDVRRGRPVAIRQAQLRNVLVQVQDLDQ